MLTTLLLVCGLGFLSAQPTAADPVNGSGLTVEIQPLADEALSGENATFEVSWACSSVDDPCESGVVTVDIPVLNEYPELRTRYVNAVGDARFTDVDYSSGTITWTAPQPLPAGSSGSLSLVVTVPNMLSPDGSTITPTVTFETSAETVTHTSDPITVISDTQLVIDKRRQNSGQIPIVDQEVVYQLGVQHASSYSPGTGQFAHTPHNGTWAVENVVIVDHLPAEAEFVSAQQMTGATIPGEPVYDPEAHAVTFPAWSDTMVASGALVAPTFLVTVRYPSGSVPEGEDVTNSVTATANPFGQPDEVLELDTSVSHQVLDVPPTTGGRFFKWPSVTSPTLGQRGATAGYNMRVQSTSNVPVDFSYDDVLPCRFTSPTDGSTDCPTPALKNVYFQVERTSRGSVTIEYTTNLGSTGTYSYDINGVASPVVTPITSDTEWITAFHVHGTLNPGGGMFISMGGIVDPDFPYTVPEGTYARAAANNTGLIYAENCLSNAVMSYDGTAFIEQSDVTECGYVRVDPVTPKFSATKTMTPTVVAPTQTATVRFNLYTRAGEGHWKPVVTDLLPENLEVVPDSVRISHTPSLPLQDYLPDENLSVEVIDDFNGTGRQLLRVSWPDGDARQTAGLPGDSTVRYVFVDVDVRVKPGTPAGTYTNQLMSFDADMPNHGTAEFPNQCVHPSATLAPDTENQSGFDDDLARGCTSSATYQVTSGASLDGTKWVRGGLDDEFMASPEIGSVEGGEAAQYRLDVSNSGNVNLSQVVVYDILPHEGDFGVGPATGARNSDWAATLSGAVTTSVPGATVLYSASANACRGEVITTGGARADAPAGCVDDWSATVPYSQVAAIRVSFGDAELAPGETWQVHVPTNAANSRGGTAWNSFAIAADRVDLNRAVLPVEPAKVGIQVPVDLTVDKTVVEHIRPDVADAAAGADGFAPGDLVRYEISVTNAGPGFASSVRLDEVLPDGLEFVDAETEVGTFDPEAGVWSFDQVLGPEEGPDAQVAIEEGYAHTALLTLIARVADGTEGSELCNVVEVTAAEMAGVADDSACIVVGTEVSGTIWHDRDDNAEMAPDEPRFEAVTVALLHADGTPVTDPAGDPVTTTSDDEGRYRFVGVAPGDYLVHVVKADLPELPDLPGLPADADWFDTYDIDGVEDGEQLALITVEKTPVTDVDFGFTAPVAIGDWVWHDSIPNGVQDAGERGVAGLLVSLLDADGEEVESMTTDSAGGYLFSNLRPGAYTVIFPPVNGFSSVETGVGDDRALDSNGPSSEHTLLSGEYDDTVDYGVVGTGTIGDFVWHDRNADGVQDDSEPGLPGVGVQLLDADGQVLAETTTGDAGEYLFADLLPGQYQIRVAAPEGWLLSASPAGDEGADPLVSSVVLASQGSMTDLDQDFGFFQAASVGDFVWHDVLQDGLQGAEEPGLGGVTVSLTDADGELVLDAFGDPVTPVVTEADGSYEFTGLRPGAYVVEFTPIAGYSPTITGAGDDSAVDSDGLEVLVTLASGEHDASIDLGLVPDGVVSGTLWRDVNGDNVQAGADETGFESVEVHLVDADGVVVATAVTDAAGFYEFTSVAPGVYTVEVGDGIPEGWSFVAGPEGHEGETAAVTLDPEADGGMSVTDQDFGYARPASIGDWAWHDIDGDGIQGDEESGAAGVVVSLRDAHGAPVIDLDGNPVADIVTDSSGEYLFENLAPGDYQVRFTAPDGFIETLSGVGDDPAVDSDGADVAVTLASGEAERDIDFGVVGIGVIDGTVWRDLNSDNAQSGDGETGFDGVRVELRDADGNLVAVTETDADGDYRFEGIAPGDYVIVVVESTLPEGWSLVGGPEGHEGPTNAVSLDPASPGGMVVTDQDFGYNTSAVVGDFVWLDSDGNGLQDDGEPGLSGVVVALLDADGEVVEETTTDADGRYLFEVAAGTYTVVFTVPDGYTLTQTGAGDDPSRDSDGLTSEVTLVGGASMLDVDLGLIGPASIGDWVWFDDNGDGLQSPGEPGLGGVSVTLLDAAGEQVAQTETDDDGFYLFEGLVGGTYTVEFEIPDGFEATESFVGGNAALDSNGSTATVTVEAGEHDATIDFGVREKAEPEPSEPEPSEPEPSEPEPSEPGPSEPEPSEPEPSEPEPSQPEPSEPEPSEPGPSEPEPSEPEPSEPGPSEPEPSEPEPSEPGPSEPEPSEPEPSEPEPSEPGPSEPEPSEPEPSEPEPSEPGPSEPEPSEPEPSEPGPSEPEPSDPEPSQPEPSEPEPSEPGPSEPEPSEPDPSQPSPTDPEPSAPGVTDPAPTEPGASENDPSSPHLPRTGSAFGGGTALVLATLLIGAGILFTGRRTRSARS